MVHVSTKAELPVLQYANEEFSRFIKFVIYLISGGF